MPITSIYAGADQADVATLTTRGVTYHCFTWRAADGARVEAKIFAEGEDGQFVLVDAAIVATAQRDEVDCPRVLAVEAAGLFVVHWIDYFANGPDADLYRSIFDLSAISTGWANQGAVALHESLLYDHATVAGDVGDEFVVARRTAAGTVTVERFEMPWTWVDADWSTDVTGLTIDDTILGCAADSSDDVVLFSYQDTNTLRTQRLVATTGVAGGNAVTMGTFDGATEHQYTAVTHGRYADDRWLVLAESRPDSYAEIYARRVVARCIDSTDASALYSLQWCWNVHLLSRAWSWAAGTVTLTEIYCGLSFKSMDNGQEFDQQYGYVARWDVNAFNGASEATIRPIPVAALMDGSLDARPHGQSPAGNFTIGCRLNHLSHAPGPPAYTLGPNLKTKLFAFTRWGRLLASQDADSDTELVPVDAGIGWFRFHHEPAWMTRRDDAEPTQPDTPAWRGASEAIALPVPTAAGLMLTGGVAAAYDGEALVEHGFMWAPEIIAAEITGAAATSLEAGTYFFYVNYAWADNKGGVHRGPPSRPVSVTAVLNDLVTLTVRCCNLTLKQDARRYPLNAAITIEVWRTYLDGASMAVVGIDAAENYIFRNVFGGQTYTLQDTPRNDPDAFTIDIAAASPSSVTQYNELAPYQLNTTTLQWTPPPPIPHQPLGPACMWQDRVFGQDPATNAIVWSEQIARLGSRYEWPRFLDTNRFEADGIEKITAMAPMDSALVVYTRGGIYALTGDPGAGGAGASLQLQQIARGLGCVEPRSVVTYSEGQVFQSAKGMLKLSRGQGVEPVGAAIDDIVRDAGNVRGAVHLEDTHQLCFPLQAAPGTGPLVVRPRVAIYDYRVGKWSIRTLTMLAQSSTASRLNEVQHATAWRGRQGNTSLVVLGQGGLAVQRSRTDTVYADVTSTGAAETVCLDVITEWFHPAGIVGQWLCDEIGIQTERVHPGPLTIQAWYNVDGLFSGTYDESTPHCTWTYAGTTAPAYIPFRLNALKVSWVKLRIFEPSSAPATENVRLVSLTLRWRALPGPRRVAR